MKSAIVICGWLMASVVGFLLTSCPGLAQLIPAADLGEETAIQNRDVNGNGIIVQSPKIYDDTSLQLMLNSAQTQLSTLQVINSTPLQSGLGAISGGTSVQSALGIQVTGGPSLGQVAQTNNGPTSQTAAVTGTTPSTTVTNTAANQSTVTTTSTPTAPTASLPSSTGFGLPTTFGANALNVLNEQMQLTYEITNLELLLEGSLSDRFVANQRLQKVRTTIGFPITIDPPKQYKLSVAVVEVEAEAPTALVFDDEPPGITALLPREKTFNVAAITNKQTAIGAGFATAVIGGSFSFLHGRSTYYVVQDQDTVALQLSTAKRRTSAFAWQFKPVLGQKYVQSGMRQTFVQLAVPIEALAGCSGKLTVRTYWRKYDEKTGKSLGIIPDSLRSYPVSRASVYNLAPAITKVVSDDLGNGQIEVEVYGQFINGTYVRIGSTYYRPGVPGFTQEARLIRFTTPASDLVKNQPQIVSRDGTEVPIVNAADPAPGGPVLNPGCDVEALPAPSAPLPLRDEATSKQCGPEAQVSTQTSVLDQSTSLLSVRVKSLPIGTLVDAQLKDYMINISGHVFGLADAPIRRENMPDGCTTLFQAAVPTELLTPLKTFTVQPLLWSERHTVRANYLEAPFGSVVDKVVLIEKNDKTATFLLVGNRLEAAQIVLPATQLTQFPSANPNDIYSQYSLAKFSLSLKDWKAYKSILVQKAAGEKVEQVSLPDPDPKGTAAASATLSVKFHPTVGTDEADFTGDDIESIKSVTYNGKALSPSLTPDKKTLIVRGLLSAGVTQTPTPKDLSFENKSGQKSTVTVDIVNFRVDTSQTSPPAAAPAKP